MVNQLILPDKLVKKHNDLIRTKINIASVHGSRILASLISCLKVEDNYFMPITIPAKEVLNSEGGENYKRIKGVIEELSQATAQVEIQEQDDPFPFLTVCPFFSRITYRKGIIRAEFNDHLQDFLLKLKKHFTQYNLLEYMLLSSTYSQRLFEILKSWSNLPEVKISLEDLHRQLSTPKSQIKHFGLFRQKILEPTHKEIIKKTNFCYEWEPIRKGIGKTSPVIAIRFIFAKKRILPVVKEKIADIKEKKEQELKLFKQAFYCAEQKKGICPTQTQEKVICCMCIKNSFCKRG